MNYTVYILFSEQSQKYYTGQTQNIDNRILERNSGETSSIKFGIPWTIVWKEECSTRTEALKLEQKIKGKSAKRFLDDLSRGA